MVSSSASPCAASIGEATILPAIYSPAAVETIKIEPPGARARRSTEATNWRRPPSP